jgi:hypothetical protein
MVAKTVLIVSKSGRGWLRGPGKEVRDVQRPYEHQAMLEVLRDGVRGT